MQARYEAVESIQRMVYRIAGKTFVVQAQDDWTARTIEQYFRGWYLVRATESEYLTAAPAIVMRSTVDPPELPDDWPHFEIAGPGTCYTNGKTSYIDIEGSIIAIGKPGHDPVQVWTNGMLEIGSPALTRLVTYALAAAMRARGLFELHSGAVVDPKSGRGVLIIGPSGSGKSTLTVQLAAAGWSFLTDDVLVLSSTGTEVKAWPLRRCFAITSQTFKSSDLLRSRAGLDYKHAQPDDKKLFAPQNVFDSAFMEQCTPKALFFSELSDGERTRIGRLSTAETMTRLIRMSPWSCYDQTTAADHLAALSSLAIQAKGYSLHAAKDLLEPQTAASLLQSFTGE